MEDEPAPRRAIVSGPNLPGARRSRPAGGTYWGGSVSAVPEPSALALLAFALLAPVSYACRPRRSRLPGGTWRMSRLPGGTSE